jgi:NAD(P)H-dependent FMN reductase
MSTLMIIVGSVRPGRIGLPIAEWVKGAAEKSGLFDNIDFVDLAELGLPFMDESAHPRLKNYTKPHTLAWSARVDAADAFVFVTPEYNHSFSPALKNAIDFLSLEWWRKPLGFVSYGGVSAGTRGVESLLGTTVGVGLVRTGANVELPFAGKQVVAGEFLPEEKESTILGHELTELASMAEVLKPLR